MVACGLLMVNVATPSAQAQTVINGGFNVITGEGVKYETEIGSGSYRNQTVISGWTADNTGIVNEISGIQRYNDGNVLLLKGSKDRASSTAKQTISFATGTYKLSFDTFTQPFQFESFSSFFVSLKPEGSGLVPDSSFTLALGENGIDESVTTQEHTFTIFTAGDYELTFGNDNPGGPTALYRDVMIDNVALEVAPEPSSTALLGLGALGLLARRKR